MSDSGHVTSVAGSPGLSSGSIGSSRAASRGLPIGTASRGPPSGLSSPCPPARLTSLRTRDFTLGGTFKKPKKTFEPNIHAVRKSKDVSKEKISVAPKRERKDRIEKKGGRGNRGRKRERPQTIQSHSIFEQGPANIICKTGWHGATELHDSINTSVSRPVKKERKPPDKDEDEILHKVKRDDFIDDLDLKNDAKLKPIQLPLCQSSRFITSQIMTSATCPKNPLVHGPLVYSVHGRDGHTRTALSKPEHQSLVDLLQDLRLSGREELFFMQLPDCMPGLVSAQKKQPPLSCTNVTTVKKEDKLEGRNPAQQSAMKEDCPVLSQFFEGFLGKLQIRQSGKVELKLGDIVLDVSVGAAFSFLQQLVSVHLSDGQAGDIMVLGNINHKLVLSPDFQTLLRQATPQQTEP